MITREAQSHHLKFADPLADLIAGNRKRTTWRLNNTRDFQAGDTLRLIHNSTGRLFGVSTIVGVADRTFGTLGPDDFEGHESFGSADEMLETYGGYYKMEVIPDTPLTVVKFCLSLICTIPGNDDTDVIIFGKVA